MLRFVIGYHTLVLATASIALLVSPLPMLNAVGIADPSYGVLSLTRLLAGLLAVLGASMTALPELPDRTRRHALVTVTAAYGVFFLLVLAQQIAIWNSRFGWVIVAELGLHVLAFSWCIRAEHRQPVAGV
jgi:hypothetical protein